MNFPFPIYLKIKLNWIILQKLKWKKNYALNVFFKTCNFDSQLQNGDLETNFRNIRDLEESLLNSSCTQKDEVLKEIKKIKQNRWPSSNPNLLG